MKIITLNTSAALPTTLCTCAANPIPDEVLAYRKEQGRIWHLIGWRSSRDDMSGLIRAKSAISVPTSRIDALIASYMRAARGPGYIELSCRLLGQSPLVPLMTTTYNPEAMEWLKRLQQPLYTIFGASLTTQDVGSDY